MRVLLRRERGEGARLLPYRGRSMPLQEGPAVPRTNGFAAAIGAEGGWVKGEGQGEGIVSNASRGGP